MIEFPTRKTLEVFCGEINDFLQGKFFLIRKKENDILCVFLEAGLGNVEAGDKNFYLFFVECLTKEQRTIDFQPKESLRLYDELIDFMNGTSSSMRDIRLISSDEAKAILFKSINDLRVQLAEHERVIANYFK